VHWRRLWPFLLGGLVGVPIGTSLLERVPVQSLKFGVGVVLILYCAWAVFMRRPPVVHFGGRIADAAAGLGGGLLGGMASISGPIPLIWVQLRGWSMVEQRGVNQPFNMSVLSLAFASAAVAGFLDRTFVVWMTVSVPLTLIGARLGLSLYRRIDDLQFRWILLALLTLSGATLIGSAL